MIFSDTAGHPAYWDTLADSNRAGFPAGDGNGISIVVLLSQEITVKNVVY